MPLEGVYPWCPSLMAFIAASCIFDGVGKSGCPIPRLIISLPSEISFESIAIMAFCSIIISTIVSIYPAVKASNLDTIKSLKYE